MKAAQAVLLSSGYPPNPPRHLHPVAPLPARRLRQVASKALAASVLGLCCLTPAHPQGCAQCRETVGQTPLRTQTAYRRAITLMTLAGATVFTASLFALKRFR